MSNTPPAAAASLAVALPPLEDWQPEDVIRWRDSLPTDDRTNFKEFFDNLPPGVKGSTLASYDKSDVYGLFPTPQLGRAFAPELHAMLQALKRQRTRVKSLRFVRFSPSFAVSPFLSRLMSCFDYYYFFF